jgi:hypothetical protein
MMPMNTSSFVIMGIVILILLILWGAMIYADCLANAKTHSVEEWERSVRKAAKEWDRYYK